MKETMHLSHVWKASFLGTTAAVAVTLFACDQAEAQLAAGEAASNLQLTDWASGLNNVTDIAFLSDGRAVIVRKTGAIAVASPDGTTVKTTAGNLTVDTESEKGLLGVVVDAQDNIYLYASTGNTDTDKHRVYKARAAADSTVTVETTPLVSMGLEGPANHDGGGLVIHKGQLYIGVGDTGANATPPQNKYSSCLNKANGKILRVNLDGSVPADNPLNDLAMVTGCSSTGAAFMPAPPDKRIYAWGFRNPWRLWIDPQTDLLWVGDVGETTEEEITVGSKGTHHGYPFHEGAVKYPGGLGGIADCMGMTPATPCVGPQDRYPHRDTPDSMRRDSSVTGGLVPIKGCGWGAYENRYFFGDYNRDVLWTIDLTADRTGAVSGSRKELATNVSSPVSLRQGPDGAIYVAAFDEGSIKRIAPKTRPPTCAGAQAPGTGGAGGGAGGSGGAAGGRDAGTDASGAAESDGCGCRVGGVAGRSAGALLILAGAAVALSLARRRRRRPRT